MPIGLQFSRAPTPVLKEKPATIPSTTALMYNAAACGLSGMAGATASCGGSATGLAVVLGATALATICDFGPAAVRDISTSNAAILNAVDSLMESSPPIVLVDNNVNVIGSKPSAAAESKRQAASDRLASAHVWALYVRGRLAGDAIGLGCMLSGRACVGASILLATHALCWMFGVAGRRVDKRAEPAPLSPPLAKIIGTLSATLAAMAALGALPQAGERVRRIGRLSYASLLIAVQVARVLADRLRARTHVGI